MNENSDLKKIVIFGSAGSGKSIVYKGIQKFLNLEINEQCANKGNYGEFFFSVNQKKYSLIDTFSWLFPDKNDSILEREAKLLNENLLLSSYLIFLVIDIANEDLLDYNIKVQNYLEKKGKEYIIIFNDLQSTAPIDNFFDSYFTQRLLSSGRKSYFLSFKAGRNVGGLKELVTDQLTFSSNNEMVSTFTKPEDIPNLTIFGPPNSGKSTLLNSLVNNKRSLVSPLAGTTRSDVTTLFSSSQIVWKIRDTEGILNKKRNDYEVLNSCQIAWVVVDGTLPVTKKTLQIISLAERCNKALFIIVNKSDLLTSFQLKERHLELTSRLKSINYVPVIPLSAKERNNFPYLLKTLDDSVNQSHLQFSKSFISQQFLKLVEQNPPSNVHGKRLKIYYALHEKGFVHKFIVFVNSPEFVHFSYHRYMVNFIRKNFKIDYLPIRLFFKKS